MIPIVLRRSRRLPIHAAIALCGIAVLGAAPRGLRAQSGLEQVERLTRMGRTEEARATLLSWWDDERGDASRRELQRGLWLRGRLTVDPVQAELDFRRLAVLYPSGQFTPDALLRLAQSAYAMGDEDGARNYVETLARDYPRSEARRSADAWFSDAGPLPAAGDTPTRAGAAAVAAGGAAAGARSDVPTPRDSVRAPPSAGERVAGAPPENPRDADAAGAGAPGTGDAAAPAMNYYVQLGAFAEEDRAVALSEEVREQGVDVRVVRVQGSRFTHVRVGRFADRAAAVELLEELNGQGINAALVRDDRPEQPIGG